MRVGTRRRPRRRRQTLPDQQLGLPDGQPAGAHVVRGAALRPGVGQTEQRARMTHAQRSRRHVGLHLGRQRQQTLVVGHRGAVLADRAGDGFLGQMELVGEPPVRLRHFDGTEILPLDVLDERQLQPLVVPDVADDDRHLQQARPLGGAPAPLAGHDLVGALPTRTHHDRLDDAAAADRLRELVELRVVHDAARLIAIGLDQVEIDLRWCAGARGRRRDVPDERAQAAAESGASVSHGRRSLPRGPRRPARHTPPRPGPGCRTGRPAVHD